MVTAQRPAASNQAPPPVRTRAVSDITFKGGLTEPFHRWFRLTPSFSPSLVRTWIAQHPLDGGVPLLDPFVGSGTTCLVAATLNIPSVGYEINPFLAFVADTCTQIDIDPTGLDNDASKAIDVAHGWLKEGPDQPAEFAQHLGTTLPRIHNVDRWWRADVLRQIVAIREACRQSTYRDHLFLALAQCVYPTANITLGRLQLAFVDRSQDKIDAIRFFKAAVRDMVEDLREYRPEVFESPSIILGDSRFLSGDERKFSGVFTSPPYPNRYSYIWNTRPHLYLLEMIDTAGQAADIDIDTIGGTWGRATSDLQKGTVEPNPNVASILGEILSELEPKSLLMRNYTCKYFNDLDTHIKNLAPHLRPGAPVGYVVGNTETKGVMVQTHVLLDRLLVESHGFQSLGIDVLRARNSGVGLVEAIVSSRFLG